jgi:AraC family transcriptional activator of mtrCDE
MAGQRANFLLCELGRKTCLDARNDAGLSAVVVVRGTVHLRDQSGHVLVAGPGQLILLPPRIEIRISTCPLRLHDKDRDKGRLLRDRDWLMVDAARSKRGKALVVALGPIATKDTTLVTATMHAITEQPSGRRTFALLRDETERRSPGTAAFAASLMQACVALALRDLAKVPVTPAPSPGTASIVRIAEKMRARPAENYDLATLATRAGMSRATFARQFAAAMRETPMQFLLRVRLEAAGAMLRSTALPVKTVAAATGFASRSHFSRAFAAAFEVDPTTYRSRAAKL